MKHTMAMVSLLLVLSLVPMLSAAADPGELIVKESASGAPIIVGVKYTSSYLTEFLWGLSRPFHFWNTQPDGTRVILPFWTRPMRDGGFLSWLNPKAWEDNANLTVGALASEIVLGVAIAGASD